VFTDLVKQMFNSYTSMQNACTWLVEITSCDVCKCALLLAHCWLRTVAQATLKYHSLYVIVYLLTCRIVRFWGITKQIVTGMLIIIENFWVTLDWKFLMMTLTPVTICIMLTVVDVFAAVWRVCMLQVLLWEREPEWEQAEKDQQYHGNFCASHC